MSKRRTSLSNATVTVTLSKQPAADDRAVLAAVHAALARAGAREAWDALHAATDVSISTVESDNAE